jgi:uncharacterized membrane protein
MTGIASRFRKSDQRGSSLICALLIVCLLMTFCVAFLAETNTDTSFSSRQEAKTAAFYIAEGGAQRAYAQLCSDFDWRGGYQNESMGLGLYNVSIEGSDSDPSIPEGAVRVTSTGKVRNARRAIRMVLKHPREEAFGCVCFSRDGIDLVSQEGVAPSVTGKVYTSGPFKMANSSTLEGDLYASGNVSIGSGALEYTSAKLYGNIRSGGSAEIAVACSVLARESKTTESAPSLIRSKGDVFAWRKLDVKGFVQGQKKGYCHDLIDVLPFPDGYFDLKVSEPKGSEVREWPVYKFDDSKAFSDFLEESYSRQVDSYFLNGIFVVNDDIEIKDAGEEQKVVIMGTLVAFGDVRISTPAGFMLQPPDSTFPAIVALGKDCSGGNIEINGDGDQVAIVGLVYAKGEIHLDGANRRNGITLTGAECAHRIRNDANCRIIYSPSVSQVMPFSPQLLSLCSWEEL